MINKIYFVLILILISACSTVKLPEPYYEIPNEFKNEQTLNQAIKTYSSFIKDKKLYLDPGHGGEDRRGKSPDGSVVEADVNLRVGLHLKNFLEQAGAIVYMSRTTDKTVDLEERSILANNSDADLFISIHHNASGSSEDRWTNYTSTYYHATPNDYEYEPSEQDLARYIQRDLSYAMRNSNGLGSFDGTYSDYWIYPGDGFSVLRLTEKPAVLIEGSFFTNPFEISRLNIDEFNKIQAWGIFKGISKFFRAGVPTISFREDTSNTKRDSLDLFFYLKDSSGIDENSITVYVDSTQSSYIYYRENNLLRLTDLTTKKDEIEIRIILRNKNGNHSFPYKRNIFIQ